MVSPRYPVILTEKRELAPNTLELTYVREDEAPISYLPGQFFSLDFFHQGEEKTRSYSAAGRVADLKNNREFRFAISAVENGAASHYFFNASPGDRVKMSGPFGALVLPRTDPGRYLLIGTGTGVAPYRAMLPELEQRLQGNPDLQVELVMGVRNPRELIYGEEFEEVAARYAGFRFHACYSRHMPETPVAHEREGRVQVLFETLAPEPERDLVYICGNPGMVDEAGSWFLERDFSPRGVKREKYKFSTF